MFVCLFVCVLFVCFVLLSSFCFVCFQTVDLVLVLFCEFWFRDSGLVLFVIVSFVSLFLFCALFVLFVLCS